MASSEQNSKQARLLDLPFNSWTWDVENQVLHLEESETEATCFDPFVDESLNQEHGWYRLLTRENVPAFVERITELANQRSRFHVRLHLSSPVVSRTIVLHGIVTERGADGTARRVHGIARPEFHFAGSVLPDNVLENQDLEQKRRLESLLLKTQRFEGVAKMAGGIAHDLNNLLAPIRMATELMQRKLQDDSLNRYIQIISDSTERARAVIQQILQFSRGTTDERADPIALNDTIWELRNMVCETFPKRIHFDFQLGHVPKVRIDPNQLHQALLNMLINARDAIEGNGSIRVSTFSRQFEIDVRVGDQAIKPGRYICIQITDSGSGIPDDIRDKIFDPFFSTKKKTEGTGLGLASVYGIILRAGGFIDVDSTPGKGTTFKIFIPEAVSKKTIRKIDEDLPDLDLQGRRVLAIDDEANLLQTLVMTCMEKGLEVDGFKDPKEALNFIRSCRPELDFAIINLHMPNISGMDMVRHLREAGCTRRFIILTGDLNWSPKQKSEIQNDLECVYKPFKGDDLWRAMSRLLNQHP